MMVILSPSARPRLAKLWSFVAPYPRSVAVRPYTYTVPVSSVRSKLPYLVLMLPPMVPVSLYFWVEDSAAALNSATVAVITSPAGSSPPGSEPPSPVKWLLSQKDTCLVVLYSVGNTIMSPVAPWASERPDDRPAYTLMDFSPWEMTALRPLIPVETVISLIIRNLLSWEEYVDSRYSMVISVGTGASPAVGVIPSREVS